MEERLKRWIMKAESDLKIGRDELMTEKPANDMICFHCYFYFPSDKETKDAINKAEYVKDFVMRK